VATVPSTFNRYHQPVDKNILYNVEKTDSGWIIIARFPGGVSPSDRKTVINWFQEYRSKVRREHPLWLTSFRSLNRGYALEVKPVNNPRELMEKGQNLKGIWTDEIANRA